MLLYYLKCHLANTGTVRDHPFVNSSKSQLVSVIIVILKQYMKSVAITLMSKD